MDYMEAIDEALHPHLSTLQLLAADPDSMDARDIPILNRTRGIRVNSFLHVVKDAARGAIPLREQAGITNWLHVHLVDVESHQWQTGPSMCHACTLWIAYKLRTNDWPKDDGNSWIEEAWQIQTNTARVNREDVNCICVSKLERLMFEFSNNAGAAGDYMWGLNVGDHQDGWIPYTLVPSSWIVPDHKPDSLNDMV
jgi:hypothetical protein